MSTSTLRGKTSTLCVNPQRAFVLEPSLAAAAGAAAGHAAVAGAAAGHDGSAGGAAWGVAHVVHGLHGVGGVVDAAVLEGRGVRGVEAAAGAQVGGDSLLGWGGGVVVVL